MDIFSLEKKETTPSKFAFQNGHVKIMYFQCGYIEVIYIILEELSFSLFEVGKIVRSLILSPTTYEVGNEQLANLFKGVNCVRLEDGVPQFGCLSKS